MWQRVRREVSGAVRSVRYDLYQHRAADPAPARGRRRVWAVLGGSAVLSALAALAVVQVVDWTVPRPPAVSFPAPPGPQAEAATTEPLPAPSATPSAPAAAGPAPATGAPVWTARRLPDAVLVPEVTQSAAPRR